MFDYANYNQLSYLKATGSQWVEVDFYADWDKDLIKLKCNWTNSGVNQMILSFGGTEAKSGWLYSYASTSKVTFYHFNDSGNQYGLDYCSQSESINPHTYILNLKNKFGIFEESKVGSIDNNISSTSPYKIRLFGGGGSYAGSYLTSGKIYEFSITRDDNIVLNLIPAQRRSDNVLGFFDEINGKFYTNQGTGEFVAGDIISSGELSMNFKGPTSATDSTQKVWTDMIACNTISNQTLTAINTFTHTGSAQALNDEGMNPVEYSFIPGTDSYINTGSWDRISGASVIIENNLTYGSELILSGLGVGGDIITDTVYTAVWNDMVDCIPVQADLKLEYGKCYCFDGDKYYLSSKYLDDGIIGIHSDTAGFYVGSKSEKCLETAIAGFALAYVDKPYKPGTPLTCTENGYLTEIKEEDIENNPHKIIGTFWKEEWRNWWGFRIPQCKEHIVEVNGRMWIKIRR